MDGKQYLTTVCWKTNIKDVVLISASTYRVTVKPLDVNEPGALDAIEIGYYLQDTLGNRYSITAVDGYNITVNDDFELGYGPRMGRVGTVFQSVALGDSPFLSPARYENLDESARAKAYAIDLDILYRNSYQYWRINRSNDSIVSKYGSLYNWYAATDVRNIASLGWKIPTDTEWTTLTTHLDGEAVAGGKLKETGTSHWNSPNTSATNSTGFTARPGGLRYSAGSFNVIGYYGYWWSSTAYDTLTAWRREILYNYANVLRNYHYKQSGFSVRLLKESTTLIDGQTGTYTGNDGHVYPTICIGTQEWVSENIFETKYRNGDLIPVVSDSTAWAALTTGAMCYCNNDESNAFGPAVFPETMVHNKDLVHFTDTDTVTWEINEISGTEIEVKGNSKSGVGGSGTENYIPKWLTDGVSLGDSPLYTLDGKVGLGLTVMDHMLDIAGVEGDNRPLRVRGSDGGGLLFGSLDSYAYWGALWSNDVAPDATNYTLATSHYGTEINMPTGASFIRFNIGGIEKLGMAASGGMWVGNGYSSNDPGSGKMIIENALGVGVAAPSARLHLMAGTATAGTSPLKLTYGTPLYTKEDGALEYDSSHLWFTIGSTRYRLDQQSTGTSYTLPNASVSTLGGIKVGTNLSIDGDGVLSAASGSYTLPIATGSALGGVKIGSGITITDGVISAPYSYTLPIASGGSLGGFKVGSGLSIDGSGILSTTYTYTLPTGSATVLGGIKVGANLSITDGVLSAATSGGDMVWPSGGYGIPVYTGTSTWDTTTLSPSTAALKYLRGNAAGTGFEWVSLLWQRGTSEPYKITPFTANDILEVSTNTTSSAISGRNTSAGGVGVYGYSTNGAGILGISDSDVAGCFSINQGTTNTALDIIKYTRGLASGTPGAGLGISHSYYLQSLREGVLAFPITGKQAHLWTDVTLNHEYSKYSWSLMADGTVADKMELLGTGQLRLNKYGTGTPFAGTAVKYLAVNSSGYVIESAGTGDSGGILLGDLSATTPLSYDNTTGVFTHLLTDGNRHLPTGGSSNNGKFLMANTTDGLYTWNSIAGTVADGTVTGQLMYWTGSAWTGSSTGKLNYTDSLSLLALGSVNVNSTAFQTRLYGGSTDAQIYGISLLRSASTKTTTINFTRPDISGVGLEPDNATPSPNGYQLMLGRSPFLTDIVLGDGTYTGGVAGDSGTGLSNAYVRFPNYTEGTLVSSSIGLMKSIAHGEAGLVWTSAGPGVDPSWESISSAPAINAHDSRNGITDITGTGSKVDMADLSAIITPNGSHLLVLFSAVFTTSATVQDVTVIIESSTVGNNTWQEKSTTMTIYQQTQELSFHELLSVSPGVPKLIKIRWNAPTTIRQRGTISERDMTIIDLP